MHSTWMQPCTCWEKIIPQCCLDKASNLNILFCRSLPASFQLLLSQVEKEQRVWKSFVCVCVCVCLARAFFFFLPPISFVLFDIFPNTSIQLGSLHSLFCPSSPSSVLWCCVLRALRLQTVRWGCRLQTPFWFISPAHRHTVAGGVVHHRALYASAWIQQTIRSSPDAPESLQDNNGSVCLRQTWKAVLVWLCCAQSGRLQDYCWRG